MGWIIAQRLRQIAVGDETLRIASGENLGDVWRTW